MLVGSAPVDMHPPQLQDDMTLETGGIHSRQDKETVCILVSIVIETVLQNDVG